MNVKSTEKKDDSTVVLEIEVPADEFDVAVEKSYQKNKKKYNVPGFRRGKVPRKVFESMYGPAVLYEDAVEMVYPDAYEAAVQEQDLKPVVYPDIKVESVGPEGLVFTATVTVMPEVKLGEYKGLTAPKGEVRITDEMIEKEMQPLIDQASRLVSVDRPAKLGDTVIIDFNGTMDGEPLEGGDAEDMSLELGSSTFVPGFEDGVVGMCVDETKDIPITFPKEYDESLANKDAVFTVTVKEIKEKELPEIDDEFAKDVSEFETLDELKKDLEENLRKRMEQEAEDGYKNAIFRQVCENAELVIPKAMIDYQVQERLMEMNNSLQSQGISLEQYLSFYGMTGEALMEQLAAQCEQEIRRDLVLDAVADAENIEPTDEEIEDIYRKGGKGADDEPLDEEELRKVLDSEEVRDNLRRVKAMDLIIDSAKVGETPEKEEKAEKKTDGEDAEKRPKSKAKEDKAQTASDEKTDGKAEKKSESKAKKSSNDSAKPSDGKKSTAKAKDAAKDSAGNQGKEPKVKAKKEEKKEPKTDKTGKTEKKETKTTGKTPKKETKTSEKMADKGEKKNTKATKTKNDEKE